MISATTYIDIADILKSKGLVLIPTDTVWCIATTIGAYDSLQKIKLIKRGVSEYPFTIVVDSIARAKKHFPLLHPRIETLLHYHQRPLTVLYPSRSATLPLDLIEDATDVAFRIEQNDFIRQIIEEIDTPLVLSSARSHPSHQCRFLDEIDASILRFVQYVHPCEAHFSSREEDIIVRYDSDGESVFVRE